ncbi:PPCS ligase, partial [Amazona guildingii]|nr:PPCS ligase [Amazona guildingii]
ALLDAFRLAPGADPAVAADSAALPALLPALREYHRANEQGRLLAIEFTELPRWLWSIPGQRQRASTALFLAGSSVMFYLAAAVSDFYIPTSELPEHKIQSSEGPLQITLKMVPKMLSPLVKEWAPEAFVISFKLETDPLILIDKSRKALERYHHQAVVANMLESRRTAVIIVTKESQTPLSLSEEEIAQGMEIEEKIVSYLQGQHTLFIEKKF